MTFTLTEQAVLKTIAYFDVRAFPVTAEEVQLYVWKDNRAPLENTYEAIEALVAKRILEQYAGVYFLQGRRELVEKRRAAGLVVEQKLKRARWAARLLTFVPFLKAVMVCNSVAEETATADSDIDVVIVAAAGRVWIVRFFANLILRLFRMRTTGAHEKDRICLSFFIDTNSLNVGPLRVVPDDIHFLYWLHTMLPVYDPDGYYERIIQANSWTRDFVPSLGHARTLGSVQLVESSGLARGWRGMWQRMWAGRYGAVIENETKKVQLPLLERRLGKKMNAPGNGIVVTDGVIKLHERDSRLTVRTAWKTRCRSLIGV